MDEYETYHEHIELLGRSAIIIMYRNAVEQLRDAINQHEFGDIPRDDLLRKLVIAHIYTEHMRIIYDDYPDLDASSDIYIEEYNRILATLGKDQPTSYCVR